MNTIVFINVISKWHVYGAESYIRQLLLSDKYQIKDIYVFIQFHYPSNKFRVVNSDFIYINTLSNVNLKFYAIKLPSEQNAIVHNICNDNSDKDNTQLIMISAKEMNIRQILGTSCFHNRQYIVVDEGMGENYSKKLWKLETEILKKTENRHSLVSNIKDYLRKMIIKRICKQIDDYKILIKHNDDFIINDEVVKMYRAYFQLYKSKLSIESTVNDGDIIFVSDNLSIMLSDSAQEYYIYNLIFKNLKDKFPNKNIWFKPHPNEKINNTIIKLLEIGFLILISDQAYEDICYAYDVITCGFGSTSLLTSAIIFNRKVYSYINYVRPTNGYGELKRKEFINITRNIEKIEVLNYEG